VTDWQHSSEDSEDSEDSTVKYTNTKTLLKRVRESDE
jgi:hypothetical protein